MRRRRQHPALLDVGGFAWDNSELVPDMWLWYSFLRTGRADVFRMAEAMTRHTGEVDTYHLGRFAHLGSRHNVRHWGCGAKEARISQAALRRFYYYLTTDERCGDIMHEQADADLTYLDLDPMRLASPETGPKKYPARIRGGPDWLACVGNWMTEWERTGNTKYRDKILAGVQSIAAMPYGFLSGPNALYGYDPATNKLYTLEDDPFGSYNLQVIMGGAEIAMELEELLQNTQVEHLVAAVPPAGGRAKGRRQAGYDDTYRGPRRSPRRDGRKRPAASPMPTSRPAIRSGRSGRGITCCAVRFHLPRAR